MTERYIYWGRALAQTDVFDLYVHAKIRPRWYWLACNLRLFLSLVWRKQEFGRMSARTAWQVAGIVYSDNLTPGYYRKGKP